MLKITPTLEAILGLIYSSWMGGLLKGEFVSFFRKDSQLDTLVQIKVMKVIRVRILVEVLLQKITRIVTLTLNMNLTTRSVIFNPTQCWGEVFMAWMKISICVF